MENQQITEKSQLPATDNLFPLLRDLEGMEIIEAQRDRLRRAYDPHQRWAAVAKECTNFFEGDQWTAEERALLRSEGRPCVTKNKIAPMLRLMFGLFRQNKYDLKFLPGNDGTGTQDVADCLSAVAKQVSEVNHSEWKDADVFQDGLTTGRAFWDLRMDFSRNYMGDIVERVVDPFSVYIDPEADTYEPSGWNFVIEDRWMSPVEIFQIYGPSALDSTLTQGYILPITGSSYMGYTNDQIKPETYFALDDFDSQSWDAMGAWSLSPFSHVNRHRKLVRVLNCQHRVLRYVSYFIDLETGQEKIIPDEMPQEKLRRIMEYAMAHNLPLDIRKGLKKVVRWTTTAGDRLLWDKWSPYDDFTLVPYFPYFRRGKTRSPVEDLLDPQREINKRSSAFLHIVMTTANSGWLIPKNSMEEDMMRALEEEGARPGIQIEYDSQVGAPTKIQPSATPMAMKQLEIDGNADLKEIAGINDSALGQLDRVQSGVAVKARQKQSVIGAEMYFDNFSRSRELKGIRTMSLIQNFYTEPRTIRTMGEGGNLEEIRINIRNAAGELENNVTMGQYQVAIDEAPISASFMEGQMQEAMQLRQMGIPIPDDILVSMSSMPYKEEIKQRLSDQVALSEDMQKLQAFMAHMQAQLPPGVPVPPVAVSPEVVAPTNAPPPPSGIPSPFQGMPNSGATLPPGGVGNSPVPPAPPGAPSLPMPNMPQTPRPPMPPRPGMPQ